MDGPANRKLLDEKAWHPIYQKEESFPGISPTPEIGRAKEG